MLERKEFRFFVIDLFKEMVLLLLGWGGEGPSEVHTSIPYGNLFQEVGVCVGGV